MKHVCVLSVREPAVGAIKVLNEGVAAVAGSLGRWLSPTLALFLGCVVLAVADSTAFLTLQVCMA